LPGPSEIPTPARLFPKLRVPVASVPRKLPATQLLAAPLPASHTPSSTLPEITLRAPAPNPPTVLPAVWISTPARPLLTTVPPLASVPM